MLLTGANRWWHAAVAASRGAAVLVAVWSIAPLAEAARLPSAGRECAICHIMWLTEFKRTDVETLIPYDPTPITPSGKEDVVSTERMCLSCHDGFVLDSRYMWKEGTYMHPVGKKPSEKIEIPLVEGKEVYPLNEDGKVYCGTCHTAHGVDWEQTESAVFMRVLNVDGQLCTACHKEKSGGPKEGVHPLFEKMDELPKTLVDAGALFSRDGGVLCQSCHKPHGAADEKILLVRNDRSQLCGECHADRYATNREIAGRLGTHPVNVRPDGVRVPEGLKEKKAKFGKEGEIICESCHSPHEGVPETSLLVESNEESAFCVSCHRDQRRVAGSEHDMRLVDADDQNVREEPVGAAGVCSACHVPHEGTGPKMWARPLPAEDKSMVALCESCHREKGLAKESRVGARSHPVGVDVARLGHPIELPTFSLDGFKRLNASTGLVTCPSCHDPHGAGAPSEADATEPAAPGKPRPSEKFLRLVNDRDSSLCRTCHRHQGKVRGTKHDLRLTAPDERNARDQPLGQSGVCGACHLVHKAVGPFLAARKTEGRADPASALCLSCHNERGPAKDKRVGERSHPVDVDVKELPIQAAAGAWRNKFDARALQALPLYDGNGHRAKAGGRIACGSCHDPHAWSPDGRPPPAQDVAKTDGGPDDSFLRITDQGKSALCVNCHVDKQPVARSKHNLKVANVKPERVKPEDRNASLCAICHMPHNAKGPVLWGRATGPGKGAIEVLCTDCHQPGANAEDKVPGRHSHPVAIELPRGMKPPEALPIYSTDGLRTAKGGWVDCATCHNPHRWEPGRAADRAGAETDPEQEGDGRTSFLRLSAAPESQLCVECHREQRAVRGTDHDLRVTGPSAVNRDGQKVAESGVCGQCHSPHNGYSSELLWARLIENPEAGNVADQRCWGCHEQGRVAGHKVPKAAKHPADVIAWSSSLQSAVLGAPTADIRVYDEAGKPAASGVIVCSSCHNPHRWDPDRDAEGPGQNAEGDVLTSFLRTARTASFTCAACHGLDSIFRYKYYHGVGAHQKHPMYR